MTTHWSEQCPRQQVALARKIRELSQSLLWKEIRRWDRWSPAKRQHKLCEPYCQLGQDPVFGLPFTFKAIAQTSLGNQHGCPQSVWIRSLDLWLFSSCLSYKWKKFGIWSMHKANILLLNITREAWPWHTMDKFYGRPFNQQLSANYLRRVLYMCSCARKHSALIAFLLCTFNAGCCHWSMLVKAYTCRINNCFLTQLVESFVQSVNWTNEGGWSLDRVTDPCTYLLLFANEFRQVYWDTIL